MAQWPIAGARLLEPRAHEANEIDAARRVAPLVVVPAGDLHEVPSTTLVLFASRMQECGLPM